MCHVKGNEKCVMVVKGAQDTEERERERKKGACDGSEGHRRDKCVMVMQGRGRW